MLHTTIPAKEIINGNVPALLNFDINYNDAGISDTVKKYVISASTAKPVLLEMQAEVITAWNGTTPQVTLGTTTPAANEYFGTGDITEATPGFYPANNAKVKKRITTDTTIYARGYSGTKQVETAVIVEAVPGTLTAGTVALTFVSALTGTLSLTPSLATNDTQDQVATKIAAALNANATFATYFVATTSTNSVIMTALYSAANDATLNLAYADGTCVGLTADATSNNTTAGVAADATTGKVKFYIQTTPLFAMT